METIFVTIISTVGVIITTAIQSHNAKKKDGIKEELQAIRKDMSKETLSRCKNDLIVLMSRIKGGYQTTTEEKMELHETKALYNSKGGDRYVDDMLDSGRNAGKICWIVF